ncbi:MAG: hypothetical protein NW220_23345 [Leptolyngbyaceae cyanobacterium bins.349]|nr:hypothetical protein [Leptolyngbyaceae cyanobacterium bins.349]
MTISTQVPELQRIIVLQPIRQHLIFAQQRLQDRHVPFHLAALSYLRICCTAMQTYQRLGLSETSAINSTTPYLTLINQLIERHPDWWKLCYVSEHGYLISGDRCIRELLQPLNLFTEQILTAPQL